MSERLPCPATKMVAGVMRPCQRWQHPPFRLHTIHEWKFNGKTVWLTVEWKQPVTEPEIFAHAEKVGV